MFISDTADYPVLLQRNLLVKPGHTHFINLNPTIYKARDIRSLAPGKRDCNFHDEGDLRFYKKYSYKSCIFECQIKY